MRKTIKTIIVASLLFLSGCGKSVSGSTSVGVLSDIAADVKPVAGIALEQKNGYDAGFKNAGVKFALANINEGASQGDIQSIIRNKVEDTQSPLIAMLGATSNNATSHAAALVNFFNIPMLVPSANGDNLFPSNNLWAFRLGARGEDYARYLFGTVITKQAMDEIGKSLTSVNSLGVTPQLKIAILYEQNTFGESAAVATAIAAMAQSTETAATTVTPATQSVYIAVYTNFKDKNPDQASLDKLVNKVKEANVQLVYLVSSDPAVAKTLMRTFRTQFDKQSLPILIGQSGGFAAQDFLASKDADGVYVLQQKIDRTDCPANIQFSYDAQSYAAVSLLSTAVQNADTTLTKKTGAWFSISWPKKITILQQREAIRDELKQFKGNVPCMGMVAFDNAGQNKLLSLELTRVKKDKVAVTSTVDFLSDLKKRFFNDLLP